MRRTSFIALALLAMTSFGALAHGNNDSSAGVEGSLGLGFGAFATQGAANAQSQGNGQAESFADGTAGARVTWGAGGFTADGFQTNTVGALTQGNAFGQGFSTGAATGFTGAVSGRVTGWRSR